MPAAVEVGPFNHAALNTFNVAASVRFYTEVLGFREVPRPSFSFAGSWLYREGLGMMLHLIDDQRFLAPQPTIETRRHHLAFRVDNFDQAKQRITAHGVEFVERKLPDYGYRQLFFHDPDGNVLELGEWPRAEDMVQSASQAH
jgi:glyoxylase I family protein